MLWNVIFEHTILFFGGSMFCPNAFLPGASFFPSVKGDHNIVVFEGQFRLNPFLFLATYINRATYIILYYVREV